MAEYIDREAVKEIMKKYRCLDCTNEKSLDCLLCQLHKPFTEISKIPTADVVEVVRCKDCKHATFYMSAVSAVKEYGLMADMTRTLGKNKIRILRGKQTVPKSK